MPRLLSIIEDQVSNLLRYIMEDDNGQLNRKYSRSRYLIRPLITILTLVLFIVLTVVIGLFLWNQGLTVAFPNIVAPIGSYQAKQLEPYQQLLITLIALMMIL